MMDFLFETTRYNRQLVYWVPCDYSAPYDLRCVWWHVP